MALPDKGQVCALSECPHCKEHTSEILSPAEATLTSMQMDDRQVGSSQLMVFFFAFAEFYGLLADCFHLGGGSLLHSM